MKRVSKKKTILKDGQDDLDDHVPEEDVKELVESDDVANNAHEDYIDDDMMIITNLDDDDMTNPYNVDSGSNDTDDNWMITWMNNMMKSIEVYEVCSKLSPLYILFESCDINIEFYWYSKFNNFEILFYLIFVLKRVNDINEIYYREEKRGG